MPNQPSLIGKTIVHRTYKGSKVGVVTGMPVLGDLEFITIQFDDGEKTFSYPKDFMTFLQCEDESLQANILGQVRLEKQEKIIVSKKSIPSPNQEIISSDNRALKTDTFDMDTFRKPSKSTISAKASEIVRNKCIDTVRAGNEIIIHLLRDNTPKKILLVEGGKRFKCPVGITYDFEIFDYMVDVMLKNGGMAIKGNDNKRLGEPGCEEDTIIWGIRQYEDSRKRMMSVMAAILEWAGIAYNRRGEMQLTADFLSQIQG